MSREVVKQIETEGIANKWPPLCPKTPDDSAGYDAEAASVSAPELQPAGATMQITLYKRTFPVKDAPVSFSFTPFPAEQIHTFSVGGQVYEAKYSEVRVTAPDDVKLDAVQNRLVWGKGMGTTKATGKEVFELAAAGKSGFRLDK